MTSKPHYTVWNKKKGKMVEAKYLKSSPSKEIELKAEPEAQNATPTQKFARKFTASIKNAVIE